MNLLLTKARSSIAGVKMIPPPSVSRLKAGGSFYRPDLLAFLDFTIASACARGAYRWRRSSSHFVLWKTRESRDGPPPLPTQLTWHAWSLFTSRLFNDSLLYMTVGRVIKIRTVGHVQSRTSCVSVSFTHACNTAQATDIDHDENVLTHRSTRENVRW